MSHTGNIRGGPRGQDFGAGREGTRVGRAPQGPGNAGSNFDRGDKTSIGRAPQAPVDSAPSKPSDALRSNDAPMTGIYNFIQQDGLELPEEVRPWDTEPGTFDEQERDSQSPTSDRARPKDRSRGAVFDDPRSPDSSRSTSERPRLPRGQEGEARADGRPRNPRDADGTRSTSDRPRVRSRGEDGEARTDSRNRLKNPNGEDGMRSDGRPRTRSRPAVDPRLDKPNTPRTGERPALPRTGERPGLPRTGERPALPKTGERPALPKTGERPGLPKTGERPGLPKTGERPALPQKPVVKQPQVPVGSLLGPELAPGTPEGTGEARPLEDLLPLFSEAIDQESLAHHFKEELGFLGMDLRAAQLPRATRAQRLWAFFVAYAEVP